MKHGFTAIELLITLFVAAMALASGYQLYAAILKEDGNTRMETTIGNIAHENVTKYSATATLPCTPSTPANNQTLEVENITNVKMTVTIDCPNISLPNLSRVTAVITYGSPEKTVTHGKYITPGEV